MHQWGSAADIYVDPKDNDRMEDLNRDGRIDIRDAKFLYDQIEELLAEEAAQKFQGGLGFYPATVGAPAVRARRRAGHQGPMEGLGDLKVKVKSEVRSYSDSLMLALVIAVAAIAFTAARGGRVFGARARSERRRAVGPRRFSRCCSGGSRARRARSSRRARAFAYGGSVIQDLGYYPFGSHFFSNLLHYVRTGDFVEAMIREAHDSTSSRSRSARSRTTRPTTSAIRRP